METKDSIKAIGFVSREGGKWIESPAKTAENRTADIDTLLLYFVSEFMLIKRTNLAKQGPGFLSYLCLVALRRMHTSLLNDKPTLAAINVVHIMRHWKGLRVSRQLLIEQESAVRFNGLSAVTLRNLNRQPKLHVLDNVFDWSDAVTKEYNGTTTNADLFSLLLDKKALPTELVNHFTNEPLRWLRFQQLSKAHIDFDNYVQRSAQATPEDASLLEANTIVAEKDPEGAPLLEAKTIVTKRDPEDPVHKMNRQTINAILTLHTTKPNEELLPIFEFQSASSFAVRGIAPVKKRDIVATWSHNTNELRLALKMLFVERRLDISVTNGTMEYETPTSVVVRVNQRHDRKSVERWKGTTPKQFVALALLFGKFSDIPFETTALGVSAGSLLAVESAKVMSDEWLETDPVSMVRHLSTVLAIEYLGETESLIQGDEKWFLARFLQYLPLSRCLVSHTGFSDHGWLEAVVNYANEHESLVKQNQEYKNKIEAQDRNRVLKQTSHNVFVDTLNGQLADTRRRLAEAERIAGAPTAQLQNELATANHDRDAARFDLRSAQSAESQVRQELSVLQNTMAQRDADLVSRDSDLAQVRQSLAASGARIVQLDGDLAAERSNAARLTTDLASERNKLTQLTGSLATEQNNATRLTTELANEQKIVARLTTELATAQNVVNQLTTSLTAAQADETKAKQDLAVLQTSAGNDKTEITRINNELANAQTDANQLNADLTKAKADAASLANDLTLARQSEAKAKADYASLMQLGPPQLVADLGTAQANLTRAQGDLLAAQADVTRLTNELAQAKQNQPAVNQLTADLNTANARVVQLTADVAAATNTGNLASGEVTRLTGELNVSQAEVMKLDGELKISRSEVTRLNNELKTALATNPSVTTIAPATIAAIAGALNIPVRAARPIADYGLGIRWDLKKRFIRECVVLDAVLFRRRIGYGLNLAFDVCLAALKDANEIRKPGTGRSLTLFLRDVVEPAVSEPMRVHAACLLVVHECGDIL